MIQYEIAPDSTDQTIYVFIPDASSSIGAGLTGLAYNSASLVAYYTRSKAAAAALTLATQTVDGAHSDGGFVEVSAANAPGMYRLDLSDAVCAANAAEAWLELKGAVNMVPVLVRVKLSIDANAIKIGGTTQTGRDIGASVLLSSGTGTGQLDFTSGVVKANLAQILGTALTETSGLIAAAFKKFFNVATPTGTVNSLPDAVAGATNGVFIAGTNAATTVTTALTTTFTGNLTGSVASVANIAPTGTGLSAIPWNAAWDAEVQSEVTDALAAHDPSAMVLP